MGYSSILEKQRFNHKQGWIPFVFTIRCPSSLRWRQTGSLQVLHASLPSLAEGHQSDPFRVAKTQVRNFVTFLVWETNTQNLEPLRQLWGGRYPLPALRTPVQKLPRGNWNSAALSLVSLEEKIKDHRHPPGTPQCPPSIIHFQPISCLIQILEMCIHGPNNCMWHRYRNSVSLAGRMNVVDITKIKLEVHCQQLGVYRMLLLFFIPSLHILMASPLLIHVVGKNFQCQMMSWHVTIQNSNE